MRNDQVEYFIPFCCLPPFRCGGVNAHLQERTEEARFAVFMTTATSVPGSYAAAMPQKHCLGNAKLKSKSWAHQRRGWLIMWSRKSQGPKALHIIPDGKNSTQPGNGSFCRKSLGELSIKSPGLARAPGRGTRERRPKPDQVLLG